MRTTATPESRPPMGRSSTLGAAVARALAAVALLCTLAVAGCDCGGGGLGAECVSDLDCDPGLYCHTKGTCQLVGSTTDAGGWGTDAASGSDAGGGGTDGGTGVVCGGFVGNTCEPDEFCDFPGDFCGADDGTGECHPRPELCQEIFDPVCACDGQTYDNGCFAHAAGWDIWSPGPCPMPGQTFPCGTTNCFVGVEYCVTVISDVIGFPDDYFCESMPPCPGNGCACLMAVPCGEMCVEDFSGNATVICPGG